MKNFATAMLMLGSIGFALGAWLVVKDWLHEQRANKLLDRVIAEYERDFAQ